MSRYRYIDSFIYEQTSDAAVWTIEHPGMAESVVVDCYILVGGSYVKAIPQKTEALDGKTIQVTWSSAVSGRVMIA